jgi:hypothetical protein
VVSALLGPEEANAAAPSPWKVRTEALRASVASAPALREKVFYACFFVFVCFFLL